MCARCGADLTKLHLLLAVATRLRDEARRALLAAEVERASTCARQAQALVATPAGRRLVDVARCLAAAGPDRLSCARAPSEG